MTGQCQRCGRMQHNSFGGVGPVCVPAVPAVLPAIECVVFCRNAAGEPDLCHVTVEATIAAMNDGDHYDLAREEAARQGYEDTATALVADAGDALFRRMHRCGATLDGLSVDLYRSRSGQLVVEIDSTEVEPSDTVGDHEEPRIRVYINDARVFDEGEPVDASEWSVTSPRPAEPQDPA